MASAALQEGDVFASRYRIVRELASGVEPSGTHDVIWDLRDENGQQLPAGIVFARLDVEGQALSVKLVTVR